MEATADYFIRIISKMLNQRIRSFDVRQEAQTDFDEHVQAYMKEMVWTGTCRSWCKSCLLDFILLSLPRTSADSIIYSQTKL